jgi:hypothetical protein
LFSQIPGVVFNDGFTGFGPIDDSIFYNSDASVDGLAQQLCLIQSHLCLTGRYIAIAFVEKSQGSSLGYLSSYDSKSNCITQVHSLPILRHATCNPQIWEGAGRLSWGAASLSNLDYLIICGEINNPLSQK